jgi:hypothetical protein
MHCLTLATESGDEIVFGDERGKGMVPGTIGDSL